MYLPNYNMQIWIDDIAYSTDNLDGTGVIIGGGGGGGSGSGIGINFNSLVALLLGLLPFVLLCALVSHMLLALEDRRRGKER